MDIIFDVDGTLLDITHRIHHIRPVSGQKANWKAFRAEAFNDRAKPVIIGVFLALAQQGHHRIVLCTGRMEQERVTTEAVLSAYGVQPGLYQELYMRPDEDYRPDHTIKLEMLQKMRRRGINPILAFDDRNQVVTMWRGQGLTCCQVDEGNF